MPESVQIFIAPPDPAVLRERLRSRGLDSAEAIDARLEVARQELAARGDFAHEVVNDELARAADELEEIVRAELGLPLDSAAE
jgi:guanylate kinase